MTVDARSRGRLMTGPIQSELSPFLQFLARSCDSDHLRAYLSQGYSPWSYCPISGTTALSLLAGHGRAAPAAIEVWLEFAGDLSQRPWPSAHPHPLQCVLSAGPATAALILSPLLEAGLPVMDRWSGGTSALDFLFPEHTPQAHMDVHARWQVACLLGKHDPEVARWEWRGRPLWVSAMEKQYVPEELLECVLSWPGVTTADRDWRTASSPLSVETLVPWAQQRFGPVLKKCQVPLVGVNTDGVGVFSALLRSLSRQQLEQSNPFQSRSSQRKFNFPRKRIEWMISEGMVHWNEQALDGQTPLSLMRTIAWDNPEDAQELLNQWHLSLLEETTSAGRAGKGRL
jgi:hypothetical protein